jgi:hypothetical protein
MAFSIAYMVTLGIVYDHICKLDTVRVLHDLPRAGAVRKAYTIVEARMAYRMIV